MHWVVEIYTVEDIFVYIVNIMAVDSLTHEPLFTNMD